VGEIFWLGVGEIDESLGHSLEAEGVKLIEGGMSEHVHRRRVPQAVEGDVLLLQGRESVAGHGDVLFHKALDSVGAQPPAADGWEDDVVLGAAWLIKPRRENVGDRLHSGTARCLRPLPFTST
jgi:hypothetical protein